MARRICCIWREPTLSHPTTKMDLNSWMYFCKAVEVAGRGREGE
jgi:hypothetical protein